MTTASFFASIHDKIQMVENRMRAQADDSNHPALSAAIEYLLASGGKRIRPALGFLVGQMLSAPEENLVTLGAAVELLHTATLVHDDLIDGSLLRRGAPTLNARWSPAATVLTGDFLFAKAAKLAAEADNQPLMRLFAETLAVIVNGELAQLFAGQGSLVREHYYQRIYAKTASLFEMSARAAAMVSPADEQTVESLRLFGREIGMAFQIVDDVLDFTGDQAAVGKPVGSDLLHGLVTLPALYYVENNPDDEDVRLLKNGDWGNHERMERLIAAIRASNAIPQAIGEARQRVERALSLIAPQPDSPAKASLQQLALYIIDRNI